MPNARKSDLIVVTSAPSAAWIDHLRRAWDAGAAIMPVDHRLPRAEVDRLIEVARPAVIDDVRHAGGMPAGDDVALVMATGGSMGEPKLVELTHAAVDAAVEASIERLGATAEDAWLCLLPFAHMGGLLCLLRAMQLGAPARFDDTAAFTSIVPTMLHRGFETAPFKAVLVGGAPLQRNQPPPPNAVTTYGMTETAGGVVYDGVPLRDVEVRIAGSDEIQIAGPTLMRGYRGAGTQPFTDDGWLRTRDAGVLDPDGRLRVLGRLDDVIITGGEKVWPDEVEAALRADPAITDVAVTGRPDPEWGSIVVAHVVPADPARPPAVEDLRGRVDLPRYKLPRAIELHDQIPHLPSGKPDRASLRRAHD